MSPAVDSTAVGDSEGLHDQRLPESQPWIFMMGFHVAPYVADGLSVQNPAVQEVSGVQGSATRH